MKYLWRHETILDPQAKAKTGSAKIIMKTQSDAWVNTKEPIILPVSIHSAFHEGSLGQAKMETFLKVIEHYADGPVTLLITEDSHANVLSMKHAGDYQKAVEQCLKDAELLLSRFAEVVEGFDIQYWHTLIKKHPQYSGYKAQLWALVKNDAEARMLLVEDAEKTYSAQKMAEYLDKSAYIDMAIADLVEQAAYLCVITELGFKFEIYPGKRYKSVDYCYHALFESGKKTERIHLHMSH